MSDNKFVICTVEGSRAKATVPAHLVADKDAENLERFFRDLLRLKPDQRVVITRKAA